jgi:Ca2+-transporting ATPase
LGLQFAGLYLPFLQELLHTQPLTGLDLAVVFLASTLGYAAVRLDRVVFRRQRPADPPGVASGGRPQSQTLRVPARCRYTRRGTLPVMVSTSRITL